MSETAITIRVPEYHRGQRRLLDLVNRCKVVIAIVGRRWGKTFFGDKRLGERMLAGGRDYVGGWVAPSFDLCNISWYQFHTMWGLARDGGLIAESNKQEHRVQFINGAQAFWRSADNPTSLRGRGYDDLHVDEAVWVSRRAYENALLPALADKDGNLIVHTTPAGRRGWVFEEFDRALHDEPGYGWIQLPTTDNPSPKIQAYVARRRSKMPDSVFRQEFLAEFTEDLMALFRGLDACIGGALEAPQPGMSYLIGADVAKTHAWTVLNVYRQSGGPPYLLVCQERFHLMDWPDQVMRVDALSRRYNRARVIVDATGLGDVLLSMMRQQGIPVRGIQILPGEGMAPTAPGRKRRKDLLDELAVAIAEQKLIIPPELDVEVEELRAMAVELDDSGRTRYRSRGEFDDCVFADALAIQGMPAFHGGRLRVEVGAARGGQRRITTNPILDMEG